MMFCPNYTIKLYPFASIAVIMDKKNLALQNASRQRIRFIDESDGIGGSNVTL